MLVMSLIFAYAASIGMSEEGMKRDWNGGSVFTAGVSERMRIDRASQVWSEPGLEPQGAKQKGVHGEGKRKQEAKKRSPNGPNSRTLLLQVSPHSLFESLFLLLQLLLQHT
jgi:hypothetical protein